MAVQTIPHLPLSRNCCSLSVKASAIGFHLSSSHVLDRIASMILSSASGITSTRPPTASEMWASFFLRANFDVLSRNTPSIF